MAWSFSNNTVTVSETETSLAGAVTAGGATLSNDSYDFADNHLIINGSLTIPNGQQLLFSQLPSGNSPRILINSTGTLTIGTDSNFGRYLRNYGAPVIFEDVDETNAAITNQNPWNNNGRGGGGGSNREVSFYVNTGGTLRVYGQTLALRGSLASHGGADVTIKDSLVNCNRIYIYEGSGTRVLDGNDIVCRTNYAFISNYTTFIGNRVLNNQGGSEENYLAGSGATPSGLSDSNRILISDAPILDNSNTRLWRSGTTGSNIPYLEFRNAANGSDYFVEHGGRRFDLIWTKGIDFHATRQDNGNDIAGAAFYIQGGGSYAVEGTSDSDGEYSPVIRIGHARRVAGDSNIVYAYNNVSNNKTGNDFRIYAWAYGFLPYSNETFKATGNGNTEITIPFFSDENITQTTRATVQAYTTLDTAEKLYDYYSSWRVDNIDNDISTNKLAGYNITRSGNTVDFGAMKVYFYVNFDSTVNYPANSYVYQNNKFYFNPSAVTAGTFNASEWTNLGQGPISLSSVDGDTVDVAIGTGFEGNIVTTGEVFINDESVIDGTIADTNGVRVLVNLGATESYIKAKTSSKTFAYEKFSSGGTARFSVSADTDVNMAIYQRGKNPIFRMINSGANGTSFTPIFSGYSTPLEDNPAAWVDDFTWTFAAGDSSDTITGELETFDNITDNKLPQDDSDSFLYSLHKSEAYLDAVLAREKADIIKSGSNDSVVIEDSDTVLKLTIDNNHGDDCDIRFVLSAPAAAIKTPKNTNANRGKFLWSLRASQNFSVDLVQDIIDSSNESINEKLNSMVNDILGARVNPDSESDAVTVKAALDSISDIESGGGGGNSPTADEIANAVRDKAVKAGGDTFGEAMDRVKNIPTTAAPTVADIGSNIQTRLNALNDLSAAEVTGAVPTAASIADAVLDEPLSGHTVSGSLGKKIGDQVNPVTPPTAASIADAVWDEALAGHATDGTAGKKVSDQVNPVAAPTVAQIGADIQNRLNALNDISAADVTGAVPTADDIADGVWNATLTDYTTAGSTGKKLSDQVNPVTPPTAAAIANAVWDETLADHTTAGSTGKKLDDQQNTTAPTAATIADAVWDESLADHTTAGSAGKKLSDQVNPTTPPTAASIADAVWDESLADHTSDGSAGEKLSDQVNPVASPTADEIANAVRDKAVKAGGVSIGVALDTIPKTTLTTTDILGASLGDGEDTVSGALQRTKDVEGKVDGLSIPSADAVANAVRDKAVDAEEGADTFGEAMHRVKNIPSAADIASDVWDATLSEHTDTGSTGEKLSNSGTGITVDQIWNAALADYTTAGSAGKKIGDQVNPVASPTAAAIADAVWDESLADHTTAGSAGKKLSDQVNPVTPPTAASIADAVWDEALAGHATDGTAGKKVSDQVNPTTPPTAAAIADAVWDEALAGHATEGSAGKKLDDQQNTTAAAIADAVWDESLADHTTAGSAGKKIGDQVNPTTPPTAASIADAVWDEALADHSTEGTAGAKLNADASINVDDILDASLGDGEGDVKTALSKIADIPDSNPSASDVASAVWNKATEDHVAEGSFGKLAADIPKTTLSVSDILEASLGDGDDNTVEAALDKIKNIPVASAPTLAEIGADTQSKLETLNNVSKEEITEAVLSSRINSAEEEEAVTVKSALDSIADIKEDLNGINVNVDNEGIAEAVLNARVNPESEGIDKVTVKDAMDSISDIPKTAAPTVSDIKEGLNVAAVILDSHVDDAKTTTVKQALAHAANFDADDINIEVKENIAEGIINSQIQGSGKTFGETLDDIEKTIQSTSIRLPSGSRKTSPAKLFLSKGTDFEAEVGLPVINGITDFDGYELTAKMTHLYDRGYTKTFEPIKNIEVVEGRKVKFILSNAETSELKSGRYIFDVTATSNDDGKITKIIKGTIDVSEDL